MLKKMPDIHPGGWPIRFSCVFLSASGGSIRTRFLLNGGGEAALTRSGRRRRQENAYAPAFFSSLFWQYRLTA
jgi:hypothetical protein